MVDSKPVQFIRGTATALPEVEEGSVCNKTAFKAGKKNFLFFGSDGEGYDVKLKLQESLEEAAEFSTGQGESINVGSNGWVDLEFLHGKSLPQPVLIRWIRESYRLLVPRKLHSQLEGN